MDQWKPQGVPFDAFDPDANTRRWALGDNDLLAMFNDYCYDEHDEYMATLDLTAIAYQCGAPHNFAFEPEELAPETSYLAKLDS